MHRLHYRSDGLRGNRLEVAAAGGEQSVNWHAGRWPDASNLTGEVAAERVMVMILPFLGADFRSGEMNQMDNTRQADDPPHPRARGNAGSGGSRLPKAATYFAHLKGYRFRSASPRTKP